MKILCFLMLIFLNNVHAGSVKLYSFNQNEFQQASGYIGIKTDSLKPYIAAWASMTQNDETLIKTYILKLQSLKYSEESKEIFVEDSNGKRTICGEVMTRGRGLFRKTYFEASGLCQFETKQGLYETFDVYLNY